MRQDLRGELRRLYADQIANDPQNAYLRYHSSEQAIASKVASFEAYRPFVPAVGKVLDWGCQHGPDAFMLRATFGSSIDIVGCDFLPVDKYSAFWRASGLQFVPLQHMTRLPFEDETFDMVVGAGVLEHTAHDYECQKEVYRVVKPGGFFVITHLPNHLSYAEFLARHFWTKDFHRRLYSLSGISELLKRTGFYPVKLKRHRLLPSNSLPVITAALSGYEAVIDRLWPLTLFCGDILVVAEKVYAM